jgi:alpha-1,6-mannosyltransferase
VVALTPERLRTRRLIGGLGLGGLAAASIPLAAPGPGLVPASINGGPGWLMGIYGGGLGLHGGVYLAFLALAFVSYVAVLSAAAALGRRTIRTAIVIAVLAFALAPPLLSQDVFSYISYARLGALHGLNPYVHAPSAVPSDAAFAHVGWRHTVSAYGPVFTLGTYPLGFVSVPVALWVMKAAGGVAVLALAALVARIAAWRGLDPPTAAAFVALNPLVLVHVVGGAHNDSLMMLIVIAGCAAIVAGRNASGGAGLFTAAAVKVSAAFAIPFAVLGSPSPRRMLAGGLSAAAVIAATTVAAFGSHALDAVGLVGENQALTSHYSVPSTLSRILGVGVDPVRLAAIGLYGLLVGWLLWRTYRGDDWLRAAGWAAFGLLLASGWLLPWYVIWVLPLAAIARDRALSGAVLTLTAFQLINRVPL